MTKLKPIKMLPARERVASVLRKAILSRDIEEGETISLEATAEQLGISITPVREALHILASDGLIQLRPNKEALVLGVNRKSIQDHYYTRALLEKEAARLVCINGADISEIEDAYLKGEEALQANNAHEYTDYNQAFHMAIWAAADNEKIKSILSSMWNGLSMGHKVTEEEYARISTAEHMMILEAIKKRDAELAGDRMDKHIKRSLENILTHFE